MLFSFKNGLMRKSIMTWKKAKGNSGNSAPCSFSYHLGRVAQMVEQKSRTRYRSAKISYYSTADE